MLKRTDVTLKLKGLRPEWKLMGEMLKIGIPTALERLAISGGQTCFVRVVSSLGTVVLAAHQLALTAESVSYMPANGFQIAATTLTGNAVGAQRYKLARKSAAMTFKLCAVCTFLYVVRAFLWKPFADRLFTPSEEVVDHGSLALRIIAFAEIFYAMASIYTGAPGRGRYEAAVLCVRDDYVGNPDPDGLCVCESVWNGHCRRMDCNGTGSHYSRQYDDVSFLPWEMGGEA